MTRTVLLWYRRRRIGECANLASLVYHVATACRSTFSTSTYLLTIIIASSAAFVNDNISTYHFLFFLFTQPVHGNHRTFPIRITISICYFYNYIDVCFCDMTYEHGCISMFAILKDDIRQSDNIRKITSILFVIRLMTFKNMKNTLIRQNHVWTYISPMFENASILNDTDNAHSFTTVSNPLA